ncbi:hypothetical protein [Mycobacterium sp. SMC-4]|uniref:hypothetical protein n=1 Tax=Mycobacterium sp. SMC-4 TaxID=2857059 RepID=UPI003D06A5E0
MDSDDLVALAVALEVSPVTLLMPDAENGRDELHLTGFEYPLSAASLWFWLRATNPLPYDDRLPLVFQAAAWPAWRLRMQIEQEKKTQGAWLQARRAQVQLESDDGDD